jgi:hypothetical protein
MSCESCRKLREEEKRMNEMLKAKKNNNVKKEDTKDEHTHIWEMVHGKRVRRVIYE